MTDITRKIEWDAGHRIPHHGGKCKNVHGHRYTLEVTLRGCVVTKDAAPDEGMVADFGDLKAVMMAELGEPWDHAMLVFQEDKELVAALKMLGRDHKTVLLPFVPTVENMARYAFDRVDATIRARFKDWRELPYFVQFVRLYETPNCWADVFYDEVHPEGEK